MRRLRLAIAGLGRATRATLPAIRSHERLEVVAVAEPNVDVCRRVSTALGVRGCADVVELAEADDVDAVYVATPHHLHREHVAALASRGKHLLVEKPLAVTREDCDEIIRMEEHYGVVVVVGPTHCFDAPIVALGDLVGSPGVGRLRMVHAFNYTDFMYRPRRPEELRTASGGGVIFNQLPHHIDMVRTVAGAPVSCVRAFTGIWDADRPTEGAYAGLVMFDGGAVASLLYSGYGGFDSDELLNFVTERGTPKPVPGFLNTKGAVRGLSPDVEADLKVKSAFGASTSFAEPMASPATTTHEHFGYLIASCEDADVVVATEGLRIYRDGIGRDVPIAIGTGGRSSAFDELCAAIDGQQRPIHDARWGTATVDACLAFLESSSRGADTSVRRRPGSEEPTAERVMTK